MSASTLPDNFLGIPPEFSDFNRAKVIMLPIPFDAACSWQRGASKGPEAIIAASKHVEFWDIESRAEPYKVGIHTAPAVMANSSEEMVEGGYQATKKLLAHNKFVITLGGDHSISVGPIKAHAERYPELTILHIDAHGDRMDEYDGTRYSHNSIMARARELTPHTVSVGIRSINPLELEKFDESTIFYAEQLKDSNQWIPAVLEKLGKQVYITFDVDAFDMSIMSSTGTPEPGGLGWYDTLRLLRTVMEARQVVGIDVVELMPKEGNHAPDYLVAKLIYKMISYNRREITAR